MSLLRLVDAALNRASEGVRTLEDLARFVLDDARSSRSLKEIRHSVRVVASKVWAADRLACTRDTAGDVGTHINTASEQSRDGLDAIAAAAGRRATEAIRTLEEAAKLDRPVVATELESLRYRLYDLTAFLEQRLGRTVAQWNLCLLLTEATCVLPWKEVLMAAIEGGVDCVQVREKHLPADALLARAREVMGMCQLANIPVIVNDRVDIALAAGAAGVHLGQHDLPVREARKLCGWQLIIGVSTHGPQEAQSAMEEGADYVGIGPIFSSTTKPDLEPSGVDRVRETLTVIDNLPHLAIGGVGPENAAEVLAAGGRGLAVGSAICGSSTPADTAARCLDAIQVAQA